MIVTIHQPDLLPYSGFWFKMLHADLFVVAVHDQFQKHGYQRRVRMRETWVSHQLVGKPSLVPIEEVQVADGWQDRLVEAIEGRYRGAKHWADRGVDLCHRIRGLAGTRLDEVNFGMITMIRGLLGITTPLATTAPPLGHGIDRLIEQVRSVGGDAYLSGTGAHAYLGLDAESVFADHGIRLLWSEHRHITGDSIVTVLMDHDDPLEVVRMRDDPCTVTRPGSLRQP